jgi:hypothetical protein
VDRRLYDDLRALSNLLVAEDPKAPQKGSDELSPAQKGVPRILDPVRTESGAFKALTWVVGSCLLVIAVAVVARAL